MHYKHSCGYRLHKAAVETTRICNGVSRNSDGIFIYLTIKSETPSTYTITFIDFVSRWPPKINMYLHIQRCLVGLYIHIDYLYRCEYVPKITSHSHKMTGL